MATIKTITNANLRYNGNSLIGKVDECTLPEIKSKMSEFTALGMIGTTEYPSGFEMSEMTATVSGYHSDLLKALGDPNRVIDLSLRSQVVQRNASGTNTTESVNVVMKASCKNLPLGGFKAHERVTQELSFAVYYIRLEIGGANVLEFDPVANIYKVDGVDKLNNYRNDLGI